MRDLKSVSTGSNMMRGMRGINFVQNDGGDLSSICIFLDRFGILDEVSFFIRYNDNIYFQSFEYLLDAANSTIYRENVTWWETTECPMLISEELRLELLNSSVPF